MVMIGGKGLSGAMNAKAVGSGPDTLVLAHGFGTDQTIWDKMVPALAEKYSVVAFDWNFSGASLAQDDDEALKRFEAGKYLCLEAYADELVDLMDEMGIKECVFVGHSMSATVGCIACVKRPDLFKHLILIGASPRYLNAEDYEGGFEGSDLEQIFKAIEFNFHGWVSAFAPMAIGANHDLASVAKFEGLLRSMGSDTALAVAKVVFLSDYRNVLEKVTTPCTIVSMSNDPVVPASVPCFIQRKLKAKSKTEFVDVDGHFPMLTAPSQLLHVIDRAVGN